MITSIDQMITLISYGNEALQGGIADFDYLRHSTFEHTARVRFIFGKGYINAQPNKIAAADNPGTWFRTLKNEGCKKLRLFYRPSSCPEIPDFMTAGYAGGGGVWMMEALYPGYSDYWEAQWEIGERGQAEGKIWCVTYKKTTVQPATAIWEDLDGIKKELRIVLADLAGFARGYHIQNWTGANWPEQFDNARRTLDSTEPREGYYHSDLIVYKNYTLTAQQVLFSAGKAWVFGAMGSWTDLEFEDKHTDRKYHDLTAALYNLVSRAIVAAVNSF